MIISNIFKKNDLNEKLEKYYFVNKFEYCCDIDLKILFEINDFDYLQPIKKLENYFKGSESNYYSNLLKTFINHKFNRPIQITNFNYELDEILLQYIKCIKNISCLLIWPIANIKDLHETEFYKFLSKNGRIHGIKQLDLTYKQIQGIIYQIYYDKSGFKNFKSIKAKQERSLANKNLNKIILIFFQADNFQQISGKDAPLKNHLRELLKKESGQDQNLKINFFLHATDNHTQCIELAQLFCNKNSLKLLEYQRLDQLLHKNFDKSLLMTMTFKNWLYQEIDLIDQIRFLIYNNIIWYILGLKNVNNLDLNFLNGKDIEDKIKYFLIDEKTKFPFINLLESEFDKTCGQNNIPIIDEKLLNPKYHLYYFGIKIISLSQEIKRRIILNKPNGYSDLIAISKWTNHKIKLPIKKKNFCFDINDENKTQFFDKLKSYLTKNHNINMNFDKIIELFQF